MSVTAPPLNDFAAAAYAYLEPIAEQDADLGYPLAAICGAVGTMFDQGEQAARAQPGRQPYQQVYDITQCPDWLLPWLGQFVGVVVTQGTTPDQQRTQIEQEVNFYRGTVQNLVAAVTAQQTETGRVMIIEFSPDAGSITVSYDPAYTPNVLAFTQAAELAVRWGLNLLVESSSAPHFEEGTITFEAVGSVTFETATLADIE
jgi:hypothetical protein